MRPAWQRNSATQRCRWTTSYGGPCSRALNHPELERFLGTELYDQLHADPDHPLKLQGLCETCQGRKIRAEQAGGQELLERLVRRVRQRAEEAA